MYFSYCYLLLLFTLLSDVHCCNLLHIYFIWYFFHVQQTVLHLVIGYDILVF